MASEKKGNAIVETIKTVVYALLIAGVFRTLFHRAIHEASSSGSMAPSTGTTIRIREPLNRSCLSISTRTGYLHWS